MRDATDTDIKRDWALFLDLDGTLLDIAPKPDMVTVPVELPFALRHLKADLDGALAIVSGRSLQVIDDLLQPFNGAASGEHGAVIRLPDGELDETKAMPIPRIWVHELDRASERWPGIVIERKPRSIVIHYRQAPERAAEVKALVFGLPDIDREGFKVMPASMAFEIKPKAASKARAVALLMEMEPFAGRTPVFVGDDVTDEDGMAMARKLGGFGLRVGDVFAGGPAQVREWIARGVTD